MVVKYPVFEVSIPFKRESVSKGCRAGGMVPEEKSFNSLQTGKRIQRCEEHSRCDILFTFQFPSNGKAYPKTVFLFLDYL